MKPALAREARTASVEYQTTSKQTIIAAIASVVGSTSPRSPTNCGNSATKNTASFGFASDVTRPSRNARWRRGATGAPTGARRSDWIPSQTSTAAPVTLSTMNATSDAATSAEIPAIDRTAQAITPSELPAIVSTPARQPPRIALRTTIAVAAPGVTVTRAAIGMNAHSIYQPGYRPR